MWTKYFSIASTIAVVCSILTTSTFQIAKASQNSVKSIERDKLMVKDKKEAIININRQPDIASIHRTLTQTYRGLNECNVALVAKHVLMRGRYLSDMNEACRLIMLGHLSLNYEVKNIELVSLSNNTATVNIDVLLTHRYRAVMKKAVTELQSISCPLVKYKDGWKVSNFFIKKSEPVGEYELPENTFGKTKIAK